MTRAGAGRPSASRRAFSLAVALLVAACLDAPAASVAPTPTRTPEPTPTTTIYNLGTTVWYEGFVIRVDRAVATLDQRGGPVEVSLRVENPAAEPADLNAPIHLLVGGAEMEPTRESRVPNVPGASFVGALMRYELQEISSVDDAVVLIGAEPQHRARIPLTDAGGDAVVFEPVELSLDGSATAGDLRIRLRGGLLRWDLPDWSEELSSELQALTLTYDVTYLGEFTGGFAFTGGNVRLRLPDGKTIGPRRDGHSQSIAVIGAKKTTGGMFSRFEIPTGMTGRFQLIVVNGSAQKGAPFTIE